MVLLNVTRETFIIFKSCLKIGGLWPPDRYNKRSWIIFSISVSIQIAMLMTRLIDPLKKCPPYEPGNLGSQTVISRLTAILQQVILRLYGSRMIFLIEATIHDWASITVPKERNIMKRHDKSGSLYFFVQISTIFVSVNIRRIMDSPFFKSVETMKDKRMICAFSDDSLWVYIMPVLNVALSIAINLIMRSSDVLFWSFAMHLSAQFKILKAQFQDFLWIQNKRESREEFRRLVERHKQLLDLSTDLEGAFRVYLAVVVLEQQVYVCHGAFSLGGSIATGQFYQTTRFFLTIALALSCIYIYYYASDYLTGCCEEVGHVFTYCEWYNLCKESRTNFSIVKARCQKPTIFTAAKLYTLDRPNFLYVVQSMYSLVSCIVAVALHKATFDLV